MPHSSTRRKEVKAWAVLHRRTQRPLKILYSEKGMERNTEWFGKDRIVPITISFNKGSLPPKRNKKIK